MTKLQMMIYLNEADRFGDKPIHEEVLRRLRAAHISGTSVFRGLMGFGVHGEIHRQHLFGVSDDRPILVIAVDKEEMLRPIITDLRSILPKALITLSPVELA